MDEMLTLSRAGLVTFLTCQRRFQLRYRQRLPWPAAPLDAQQETAVRRGQQFHRLLERHFLGLPIPAGSIEDATVQAWWDVFQAQGPAVPNGRFLPELRLTVPAGRHLLSGRFDLLVISQEAGQPHAHVFDWKTGHPQRESELRAAWQTRLYLALLAESGGALLENGRSLAPDHLSITYWYVQEPAAPRTISYSQAQHAQNWAEIQAIVAQIDAQLDSDEWPLTAERAHCRTCAYQVICGRQEAGTAVSPPDEEPTTDLPLPDLEPLAP